MTKLIIAILLFFSFNVFAQFYEAAAHATKDLKYVIKTDVKKDGSSHKKFEIIRKIETDAGRMEVALTKVNFYKSAESFKLIEAYSLNNNVKNVVDSKKILTRNADIGKFGISDYMEVIIPFDNVNVGSEVHLTYELSSLSKNDKYFSDLFAINNSSLATEEAYYYTSELPFRVTTVEFHPYYAVEPAKVDGKEGYVIKPRKQAYQTEGIDIQSATFAITNVPSWEDVRKFEAPRFEQELKKPLPKKYEQILQSAKKLSDPKEIIDYVAAELAKAITYAGDWQTERGKLVPQAMATAAAKGRGDCKDYTTAMVAILRKLDFTAYPFLTFRSKRYEGFMKLHILAKVPMPRMFNHVIAHVKDKTGKSWWVDPTNPYVQADIISSDILGNFGLLLDETGKDVMFLPEKNSQPANMTIMRSIVIEADNSINGKAVMTLTPSSHNAFGMIERMYGQQGLAKAFGVLLNPTLRTTKVDIKKSDIKDHKYEFDFVASDWIVDQKKLKLLVLLNPLAFLADRFDMKKDIDIGEPGITKVVTRIKKQKVEDSIAAGCLVRSRWFEFDRVVENTADALIVTDELNVKQRLISKWESDGKVYQALLGDIGHCVRAGSALVVHMDPSLKTPADIAEDKKNGPLIESMNDSDADALYNLPRIEKTDYIRTKIVRYYQNKVKTQPSAQSYRRIGNSIINLGYLYGDLFGDGYMNDGLEYYNKALPLASGKDKDDILEELIGHKVVGGRLKEAIVQFNEYYKNNPKKYKAFDLAAQIALVQKKDKEAESWLKAGEKYAQTKDEKVEFNKSIQDVYWKQKKYAESIPHQEKVLELVPNAWNYHNLAVLYLQTKNFDKVIELENKALSLMEFGMAKQILSEAYAGKFTVNVSVISPRSPASDDEAVDLILKAIKYDSTNVDALSSMALLQAREFSKKKDKTILTKGKGYLEQAASLEPAHFKVQQTMRIYKDLEQGKEVSELLLNETLITKY